MSVEIDSAYITSVTCIESNGNAPEVTTFDPTKTYTITVTPNS